MIDPDLLRGLVIDRANQRDRLPSQDRDRRLDRRLRHLEASFGVRWTHPRGGLWMGNDRKGPCALHVQR